MYYFLFGLLTVSLALLLFVVFKYSEHRKSLAILYFILINSFYGPAVYYVIFNGRAYKAFSESTFNFYQGYSIFFFVMMTLFVIGKNKAGSGFLSKPNFNDLSNNKLVNIYIGAVSAVIFGYILLYLPHFPLVHLMTKFTMIERPDMSGAIPLYYTFSTFIHFILPAMYLYYFDKIKSNKLKWGLFVLLSFLLLLGGNKGVLVYFFIFVWVFIFKLKINLKLAAMLTFAFTAYMIISGGAIASGIRRFFVTQGAGLIARFELIFRDFDFDFDKINQQVFYFVYGYPEGSQPTFFAGDFTVIYGIVLGTLITLAVLAVFMFISKFVDIHFSSNLFVLWSFTVCVYLVGMGSLDFPKFSRIFAVVLNVVIVLILEKYGSGILAGFKKKK
ncbi:hypothetical protein [Rossellomorea sp. NS-SX7]|uniref:hypothetical protein n=1 Tax=Rossellomorea sp. NS-SX7 TaxID=3463856 RepID=UPI00405A0BCE